MVCRHISQTGFRERFRGTGEHFLDLRLRVSPGIHLDFDLLLFLPKTGNEILRKTDPAVPLPADKAAKDGILLIIQKTGCRRKDI